jgi:hypothetical protein
MYFKDFNTAYKVAGYYVKQWNDARYLASPTHHFAILKIQNADSTLELPTKYITLEEALRQVELGLEPRIKVFIKSAGVTGENPDDDTEDEYDDEIQTNVKPDTDINKELEEKPKFEPKFLTSNAISLSGHAQLVIRFYGNPEQIHENYDFVHCTNYWTSWDTTVILKERALEAILNKELIYVGSKYPLCSVIRTRKFINRGWTINAGQYLKMIMQLNDLDLKNIDVLEDQLVGVDSAYFGALINELRQKQDEDACDAVDSNYAAKIIDKLF